MEHSEYSKNLYKFLELTAKREEIFASDSKRKVVEEVIYKKEHLFTNSDQDLTQTDTIKMTIDIGNNPPISLI